MVKKVLAGVCSFAFLVIVSASVQAQSDLPKAEKVIENYIAKTGGVEKYKAIKNAKISGEMSMPAANLQGKVEIVFVMPNKFHFSVDMGGLGKQERGSDGKVIWENSTVQGARLIDGDEAEQLMQEVSMASILNPLKYYKSMKTVGKETVKGEECYVLEMTKKNGDVDKDYYSVKSGLKVKSSKKVESPLGKIEVETFETNYKKSKNGIMTSWSAEQKVGPNAIFMKMKSVEFNTELGDVKFDLPEAVKELIEK